MVFSRSLEGADSTNRRLKEQSGKAILLLGSSDLAGENLIDEYRIMVKGVLLGRRKPVLAGLAVDVSLELREARTFGNGNVLLS